MSYSDKRDAGGHLVTGFVRKVGRNAEEDVERGRPIALQLSGSRVVQKLNRLVSNTRLNQ